jgi:hypothetical protein
MGRLLGFRFSIKITAASGVFLINVRTGEALTRFGRNTAWRCAGPV